MKLLTKIVFVSSFIFCNVIVFGQVENYQPATIVASDFDDYKMALSIIKIGDKTLVKFLLKKKLKIKQ